jgi:hypothetical protein
MASLSERLESAACVLAGAENIKDRLACAWSLHLADLELRDFPRDVRDQFAELIEALSRERALPGDTVLKASLRKLSNSDAGRYAALIVRTYGRVASLKSAQVALLPERSPVVPNLLAASTRSARAASAR